jgi:hypothetical protein
MSRKEPAQDLSNSPPAEQHITRKRPVSDRKVQANRRNALRSTGPTTARGKRNVSRNAIKHGIFAREVVIAAGEGEENLKEFHDLVEKLREDYEPVGVVEESLVETIATCWWRKARVLRAENGEICKRLDAAVMDQRLRNLANVNLALSQIKELSLFSNPAEQKVHSREEWSALQVLQRDVQGHDRGLKILLGLLTIAKSEIASSGYIPKFILKDIFNSFCSWDDELANACLYLGAQPRKMEKRQSEDEDQSEEEDQSDEGDQQSEGKDRQSEAIAERQHSRNVALLVSILNDRLKMLRRLARLVRQREVLVVHAEARSFSLPPAEVTDKLQRYEAHLDKQLYRAMDQLERMQRQRKGEAVLPPLNINLGRGR